MENHLVFISYSTADKPIADAICHHLEADGIRCWIAPRDITASDWAGSIMDGLRRSDVYVIIVSRNSIASGEVTKEVTEATRTCQYILPFKVDGEELSDRLRYHLAPCHWLDAVVPPLEQRIEELKQRIWNLSGEDSVYVNAHCRKLVEKMVYPKGLFVGRDNEIETIAQMLEENHVLFLQGMGGIGKSEIAKGYAKAYRNRYDTVIFASYTSNLLDLVNGDEIIIENLHQSQASGEDAESPEAYFRRKLQTLKELSSSRTLLIIDNFDTESDEHLEDLINGPYHLIFTTRNDHSSYPTLPVHRIRDFETVRKIFAANYGRSIAPKDEAVVDEILQLVNCHTITVELIAKQMKASFAKPQKMLELLKASGTNTHLKEKVKREGEEAQSAFAFIRGLFQLSGLTEGEKYILCCMCMVPYSGIEITMFGEFLQLEDYDEINSLLAKSWLMLDEDTDMLMLHPVIGDVVRDQCQPTPGFCKAYIHALWAASEKCWFMTVEERNKLQPLIIHIMNHYPEPEPELWMEYNEFGNICWICGNFAQSIASCKTNLDYAMKTFGKDDYQTGLASMYLASAYHNSGDNENAEPYYRQTLACWQQAIGKDNWRLGESYMKVGRCAFFRKDYEEAKKYYDLAKEILESITASQYAKEGKYAPWYGDLMIEYDRLYIELGEYEKAMEYAKYSYDIYLANYGKEITNCVYCFVDMGICFSALKRFSEADEYLERALALNVELNGEASMQTMRTREAIADNNLAKGDCETAKKQYLELEMELEQDFGEDNPQVIRLREKCAPLLS